MKRLLAFIVFAFALGGAITSCGGAGSDDAVDDKLTIVGAGS